MVTATEIAGALTRGQQAWRALAQDVLLITAPAKVGAKGTFNEATGQYDSKAPRRVVYHGPGRMQVKVDVNSNVIETTAGEREWTYLTSQLQLPAYAIDDHDGAYVEGSPFDVDVDHVCEVLASVQPALVGHVFNVTGPFVKTHAVYLRMRVREVAG